MFNVYLSLSCMSKMQLDALSPISPRSDFIVITKNNKTILLVFPFTHSKQRKTASAASNKHERNYDKVLIQLIETKNAA